MQAILRLRNWRERRTFDLAKASMVHPIGGLGTATEDVYNLQHAVPLFKFRDLAATTPSTKDFEKFMGDIDAAVQARRQTFANAPQRKKPCIPASCYVDATSASSVPTAITPAPTPSCERQNEDPDEGIVQAFCVCEDSITLRVLPATSAQSTSCAYKSIPTDTTAMQTVIIATEVWTHNCAACTLVGIAAVLTCTTVSEGTATVAPTIAA
ncbi:hypothetical protein F4824DRAFT_468271 [Ustulina deusta]|nr:hypothetical protein F4824DRAFT_468271 [Ustulina deusta]